MTVLKVFKENLLACPPDETSLERLFRDAVQMTNYPVIEPCIFQSNNKSIQFTIDRKMIKKARIKLAKVGRAQHN